MAKRLSKPVTGLGVLVNFCRKASLRLCAGSVEMMSTFLLAAASCTARLQDASNVTTDFALEGVLHTLSLYLNDQGKMRGIPVSWAQDK